ncbi:MAG: helix-turn-helix domain-containing protein [Planctomycetota bacterium]|nr:helix-turn-helix domain-containing protein [Planctomycetota bacterium]
MTKHLEDNLDVGHSPEDRVDLIRVTEAARELSASRSLVYSLMDRGELAYVKLGKSRRIPRQALRDLVVANLVGTMSGVQGARGKSD